MNELDITFDQSPWERFLMGKTMGDTISAVQMLTLLEGEEEQAVEEALEALETACMELDVSQLPPPVGGEAAQRLVQERQWAEKDMNPAQMEPGDPLRLYLEEVAAMPQPQDREKVISACAQGEEKAQQRLTEWGLGRVIELAAQHTGHGVLLLDLIQEGSLGLWKAVQTYRGGDFDAFRDRWIRFYQAKAIVLQARACGVGQKLRTSMEDYRAVDERLLSELGRNPTLEEIADAMHVTAEEADSVRRTLEDARILAQVRRPQREEEEEEEARNQSVEDTAYFQMRQRIQELLSGLSEEDTKILTLRFGLEGGKPLTPEETGRRLGLTADEVVAREGAALAKLRG